MGAYVDLHTHTTYSDGILTPEELLQKATGVGLAAISITDHDSIDGCIEAREFSKEYSVEIIDGIEFSCYEDGKEYHILGYNFDIGNPELLRYVAEFREERYIRAEKIVAKLNTLDIAISFEQVEAKAGKAPIARPHVASVLNEMEIVPSLKEAFWKYLAEGKPAYEPKSNFSISQALKVINKAGGVAVLAHPGKYLSQEELSKIIKIGIDGIEVLHPSHDQAAINFYKKTASQYWLLATGGSDYHGNREYDDENFGKYIMPYSVVDSIKYHSIRR
jgi:predicted metal-dependent phosphoesterase TrpH